jgi:hypothetical protein
MILTFFGIILLIFVIGLLVSKGFIRNVFFAGLRFIFIACAVIAAVVWVLSQYDNSTKSTPKIVSKSAYDGSAYLKAQKKNEESLKKKEEALKVGNELLKITKTLFYNELCYKVWGQTKEVVSEIYRKYQDDLEWKDISSIELLTLIDEGFAEVGGNEVVIFQRNGWNPIKPPKRNDKVRKATVPLSQYYYGPASASTSYVLGTKSSGYLSVVPLQKEELILARKQMDYRRKLEGDELKRYNNLLIPYEKYEAAGFYK